MQYPTDLQSLRALDTSSIGVQRRAVKLVKGLDNKSYEKWLRELGFSGLVNSKLSGDLYN